MLIIHQDGVANSCLLDRIKVKKGNVFSHDLWVQLEEAYHYRMLFLITMTTNIIYYSSSVFPGRSGIDAKVTLWLQFMCLELDLLAEIDLNRMWWNKAGKSLWVLKFDISLQHNITYGDIQ